MHSILSWRLARTLVYGGIFGFVTGYVGVFIDHWIECSPSSLVMYARDSRYFWFTIPSIPGEFLALLTSHRDWLGDDEWTMYRVQVTAFNSVFWLCAFPVLRSIFIRSRLYLRHRHA
jgi:hypothetical protein